GKLEKLAKSTIHLCCNLLLTIVPAKRSFLHMSTWTMGVSSTCSTKLALWYKILELRFLLQKPFSSSNRLPQDPVKFSFCEADENILYWNSKRSREVIKRFGSLYEFGHRFLRHKRIASSRDKSINKWQRITQVTTGAAAIKGKLHAFNQDITNQVAAYMRDPSRMIKQMRLRKSTVSVFESLSITYNLRDQTREDLETLYAEANAYALASHIFWALWALIQ
ncbi:hypothetical protein S245_060556, partial [Arachis hypogaea]